MAAHEKRDNLDECLELLEKMKQTGYHLDHDVYSVVISLACELGGSKGRCSVMEQDGSERFAF